ncbi:transposon-encoded TnpW family protein [Streptococcus agalactiae]
MHENRNEQNTGTKTIKKIGKATYEVVVHFNENVTETMQDKLKRIMLREMEQEKDKKPIKMIRKSLTSCYRKDSKIYSYILWCKACSI